MDEPLKKYQYVLFYSLLPLFFLSDYFHEWFEYWVLCAGNQPSPLIPLSTEVITGILQNLSNLFAIAIIAFVFSIKKKPLGAGWTLFISVFSVFLIVTSVIRYSDAHDSMALSLSSEAEREHRCRYLDAIRD